MALPALTWRQLPTQVLTSGYTIVNLLDAIYTAYTSTSYINGVARAQNVGFSWWPTKVQISGTTEALYMSPPTNALNQQVILGGSSAARSITLAPSQPAYTANVLYGGLNKNSGAFTAWTNALPFTTGSFSGYMGALAVQAYNQSLRCFESQDGILMTFNFTGTGNYGQYFFAGGLVDPETGNTTTDAESDGKLYALGCGIPNAATATVFDGGNATTPSAANYLFAHQTRNAAAAYIPKLLAFTPGAAPAGSVMLAMARQQRCCPFGATYSTRSGQFARLPIALNFADSTLAYTDPQATWAGRLREICFTKTAAAGTTLRNSGSDVGYYISDNAGTLGGAFVLSY